MKDCKRQRETVTLASVSDAAICSNRSGFPGALSMVEFGVRWAFFPVKTQSDKNVQPTFIDLTQHYGAFRFTWLN